jgi:hypothetical protein
MTDSNESQEIDEYTKGLCAAMNQQDLTLIPWSGLLEVPAAMSLSRQPCSFIPTTT